MAEALFYHLTARTVDDAAPELLERCLARGWRVTLRAGMAERVEALNAHLWTFRDDSFLPHGSAGDGEPARQPIYLTAGPETPNRPDVLFLIDDATAAEAEFAAMTRVVLLFDGRDEAALGSARAQWKAASRAGVRCVYWAQNARGAWEKRSESG